MPVYRQWAMAADLAQRLRDQNVPPELWEVIFVANDGHSGLPQASLGPNMRVIRCDTAGSYAARNAGLAQARGRFCLFTDADCLPPQGWVAAHLAAAHQTAPIAPVLAAGPVRMVPPPAGAPLSSRFWACFDLIRGIPQERYVTEGFAATANLMIPRALFSRIGPFDISRFSGGDIEFCRRALADGCTLSLAPEAWTGHPCRSTWAELSTKARRVAAAEVQPRGPGAKAILRRLTPPLRAMLRFAKSPAPVRHRAAAMVILLPLWGAELYEMARVLVFGLPPERR